jgi:hypothetical protein
MRHSQALAVVFALAFPHPARAQTTPVPIPIAHETSIAYDVNARREVAGNYFPEGIGSTAFFFSPRDGFRTLSVPGSRDTSAFGVNNRGQVVGSYGDGRLMHGFVWSGTSGFTTVDAPDAEETTLTDISERGVVVGFYRTVRDDPMTLQGFTIADGRITLLDNPWGFPVTIPEGIAEDGTIVGYYMRPLPPGDPGPVPLHGFVLRGGVWSKLDLPNATGTAALGISPDGTTIVGFGLHADGQRGFFYRNGRFERLDVLTVPYSVTDSGLMAGHALPEPGAASVQAVYISTPLLRPLRINTPNRPSKWGIGTTQRLAWTYAGDAAQFQIEISRDGGTSWDLVDIVANKPGPSQNYLWPVSGPETPLARFRVSALGTDESDVNDAAIRIGFAAIEIVQPIPNRLVPLGSTQRIFWKHNLGARVPVAIEVSGDGGASWRTIAARALTRGATTSSFPWRVDVPVTTRARIRVRALDGSGAVGMSHVFEVVANPGGAVLSEGAS